MSQPWGQCKACHKWGWAPREFDERRHFMRCSCGNVMYLVTHTDPVKELALRERDKVTPTLASIKEQP